MIPPELAHVRDVHQLLTHDGFDDPAYHGFIVNVWCPLGVSQRSLDELQMLLFDAGQNWCKALNKKHLLDAPGSGARGGT